ncbi:MFS transporter [Streptomyces sulfonofaciens]|uniref:MFS transporter n=1 Tax=Streptomyces sulfonofaciens TaxID=68272 RepID=UPI00167598F3|nr:MFS transporter [Streptomyces sulfonofaciens]
MRTPAFRRFLLANLVSATGTAMAPLALAYAVLGTGGGAGSLGVVLTTTTVPAIVFSLAGGVLADRLPRSRLLFGGNLLAAGAQAALALLVGLRQAGTFSIAACGFVSGVATALIAPAAQGVVAQIVAPGHRQQANALVRLPGNGVRVLGPALGGVLVAAAGPAWALGWDACSFLIAAFLLLGLRLNAPAPPPLPPSGPPASAAANTPATTPLADLRAGWHAFRSRTWLWTYSVAGTVVVAAWLAGYQLLGPIVAAQRYDGARAWGLVQGAFALGLLAGTVVCLRWRPKRLVAVAVLGSAGLALPPAAMGLGLPLFWVLLGAGAGGIGLDIAVVAWTTALQHHVAQGEQGRMSSFTGIGERLAVPFAYLAAALAAHTWGNGTVLLVCAAVIAAATVLNLCVRDVHRVDRRTPGGTTGEG